jgi:hypothetical protein
MTLSHGELQAKMRLTHVEIGFIGEAILLIPA